jgi:hypothetical protein
MLILDWPGGFDLISGGTMGFEGADGMRLVRARIVAGRVAGGLVSELDD